MSEPDKDVAVMMARGSEAVGLIFCGAGAWIGYVNMDSGFLQGSMGLALGLSATLPTLGVGILLVVAGRILRAVTDPAR